MFPNTDLLDIVVSDAAVYTVAHMANCFIAVAHHSGEHLKFEK